MATQTSTAEATTLGIRSFELMAHGDLADIRGGRPPGGTQPRGGR